MKRKICVFTGARSEYGLLKPLMAQIKEDKSFKLQTIVSGMHLSPEFGNTYKEIEKDGFKIDARVKMLHKSDTSSGLAKSLGQGVIGLTDSLESLNPDMVVVFGDRYEAMSMAIAAMAARIPIAHLSGGESAEGVIDEQIRHCISKMSHLHFTSMEVYRRKVIQLGEDPKRVFRVGAIGLDNIRDMKLLSRPDLEKQLGIRLKKKNLLITYHPLTAHKNVTQGQFRELLSALDELKDTLLIFTKANADTEGRIINRMIEEYVRKNPSKAVVYASLGQLRYLSLLQFVDGAVGNSSSGIIEVPSFRIGTVNIGDRQQGRFFGKSIICCQPARKDIRNALKKLYSPTFKRSLRNLKNPYGDGRTAPRILKILKNHRINDLKKEFHYIY